ncbi:hypothetical protein Acr_13g0006000 [Actinidia rufa]|uniref:DUF4283 domain-containing protein n=1 Tax=Actinidia rufa TaxID=165716 RepID=A0A7J0FM05_9ERIC|nr:hypothetical protein Acr_13g0006000 [Actinidia rufa]
MGNGKNKPNKGGSRSVLIRYAEIDGRSIAVVCESKTGEAKATSYAGSSEMCESDRDDFEEELIPKGAEGEERADAREEREVRRTQKKTTSFAGLFSRNRMPSDDNKLERFNQDEGPAMIELEHIRESNFLWEQCLVGYFGGRFPGRQALRQITNSWKVQVTVKYHGSEWIVFQFSSEDDKANVLGKRPYIIYGRPLLLKAMPPLFKFGSKPIYMDKLTTQKERITYARCLVEIDMAKEIKHTVKNMGHTTKGCKANSNKRNAAKPIEETTERGREIDATIARNNEHPGTSRAWTQRNLDGMGNQENKGRKRAKRKLIAGPEVGTDEAQNQAVGIELVTDEDQNLDLGTEIGTEKYQNSDSRIGREIEENLGKAIGPNIRASSEYSQASKRRASGGTYTCQTGRPDCKCKLDRVMVSNRWNGEGLRAHANFGLLGKLSDHSPCVIALFDNGMQRPSSFKFFNMWAIHEDFQEIVERVWGTQIHGSAMFRLCRKLKLLKDPLKVLNKKHFSHISSRVAEERVQEIQQQLHDNPINTHLYEQMAELKPLAFRLEEAERSYCS